MENIGEKVAYLKGLAEGLKVDDSTNEGKIIKGILDVLSQMHDYIVEIDDDLALVSEELEAIDEDLTELENDFYEEDEDFEDEDDDMYEIVCPKCGEEVYVDGDTLESDDIYCPSCKEKIEFEIPSGCDCDCDCGCDCKD